MLKDLVGGVKNDLGKRRWGLFPWKGAEKVLEVVEFGAKKYEAFNWMKVLSQPNGHERYYEAAMRHMIAYKKGETTDPESGKSHLAHACVSLLFLLSVEKEEIITAEKAREIQKENISNSFADFKKTLNQKVLQSLGSGENSFVITKSEAGKISLEVAKELLVKNGYSATIIYEINKEPRMHVSF